jgi:hypothetical protein
MRSDNDISVYGRLLYRVTGSLIIAKSCQEEPRIFFISNWSVEKKSTSRLLYSARLEELGGSVKLETWIRYFAFVTVSARN